MLQQTQTNFGFGAQRGNLTTAAGPQDDYTSKVASMNRTQDIGIFTKY